MQAYAVVLTASDYAFVHPCIQCAWQAMSVPMPQFVLTQLLNTCFGLQVLKGTHVNAVITREQTELQVQHSSPHVIDSTPCMVILAAGLRCAP